VQSDVLAHQLWAFQPIALMGRLLAVRRWATRSSGRPDQRLSPVEYRLGRPSEQILKSQTTFFTVVPAV
jgi:hypothetical protein